VIGAILLLQLGNVAVERQVEVCLAYIWDCGYRLAGWIQPTGETGDAARMIRRGEADVVVVAYGGEEYAAEIVAAGGRLEAVHPAPHVVEPPVSRLDLAAVLSMLRATGRSAREIAEFIGESTAEVRRLLRRK
jgi:hypothetical protein